MRQRCYLRIDSDYLSEARRFESLAAAREYYASTARELARYEQRCEASVHIAPSRAECDEYPDYVLSLGPRGGIRTERC